MRPDVGTQARFNKRQPPKTYHYDSSLSPALGPGGGVLRVALDRLGQQVEQFVVDSWTETAWERVTTGTTIGYGRILVLDKSVTTDKIRVQILDARSTPHLSHVGVYLTR